MADPSTPRSGAGLPGSDFTGFYRENSERVLVFLARRTLDPELALELTAETFARAFSARRRFRGTTPQEAAGWVLRIADRQLATWSRRGRVERRAMDRLGIEVESLSAEDIARVEERAELATLRGELARALSAIAPAQLEAIRLRVVEDLPYEEVARRLAISQEAARARVSRGLRELGRTLDTSPSFLERS